jgi:hypothetical protein
VGHLFPLRKKKATTAEGLRARGRQFSLKRRYLTNFLVAIGADWDA